MPAARLLVSGTDRKRGRCEGCPPAYDEELYDRLRAWRLERSRADSVPAYVVLTDATLEAVATRRPDREGALVTIPGIGAAKLQRYGDALLDLGGRPRRERGGHSRRSRNHNGLKELRINGLPPGRPVP